MEKHFEEHYKDYISKSTSQDIETTLVESHNALVSLVLKLDEKQLMFRYQKEKWSIKDIIQHLIDVERVFVYRAVRFARNDNTVLHGFDEDDFVKNANADRKTKDELLKEYVSIHRSTILFYNQLTLDELEREGMASGVLFSVFGIAHIISGHIQHHIGVVKERYL